MEITELIGSSEYISGACSLRASLRGNLMGPISLSLVYSHIFWDSQISKSRLCHFSFCTFKPLFDRPFKENGEVFRVKTYS